MSSGENLSHVDERLEALKKSIDGYLKWLSIDTLSNSNQSEVYQYLDTPYETIKKWTAEDCEKASYILMVQATFIQTQLNKLKAIILWANSNINFIIAPKLQQYNTYLPADSKRILAIQDSTYTKRLEEIITTSNVRLESINFIPQSLRQRAEIFLQIAQNKRNTK